MGGELLGEGSIRSVADEEEPRRRPALDSFEDSEHVPDSLDRPEIRDVHEEGFLRTREGPGERRERPGLVQARVYEVRDDVDLTLDAELALLDWAIKTHFTRPEELALAMIPDRQGLGGSSGARPQG